MVSKAEKHAGRIAIVLIGALFIAFFGFKAWHIGIAVEAYRTQPIAGDTTGAAK